MQQVFIKATRFAYIACPGTGFRGAVELLFNGLGPGGAARDWAAEATELERARWSGPAGWSPCG
jgi:hypothetical protein